MRRPLLRRALAAATCTAGAVVAAGQPAGAHATFAEVGVPAESEQRITMFVPEERGPTVHNVGIDLRVPAGWSAVGCQQVAPWTCQVADGGVIKWTKAPGAAPSEADTMFVFTVRTGAPGTVSVPVVQTYDSGEVVRWIGPADAEEPAAFIEVLPQGAPVPPTTALTTTTTAPPGAAPTTTRPAATTTRPVATTAAPTTAATTTTAPPATTAPPDTAATTTSSVPEASTSSTSGRDERDVQAAAGTDERGGSALPAVLGLLTAAALALAGWTLWRRRRRGPVEPPA